MLLEKYTEETIIYSYQTNQHGDAKVSALFNIMLEAAWTHANQMDWGYDDLKDNQMFWVLSRIRIEIKRLPQWQDKIYLETWPAGNDRMFAYREFRMRDEAGNEFLRSNSAWLILNLATHKIISFNKQGDLPSINDENSCIQPKRLRYKENDINLNFQPILYSDIDVNKHFNSVRAFERVVDAHEAGFQKNYRPKLIEINYLKEGFEGQQVGVKKTAKDNLLFQSALIRRENNEPLSLYEIQWTEID
ncbi:MAG: acyl-[acyl-carrier-protein] thioesterase [Mangrovibacterium sp.]